MTEQSSNAPRRVFWGLVAALVAGQAVSYWLTGRGLFANLTGG